MWTTWGLVGHGQDFHAKGATGAGEGWGQKKDASCLSLSRVPLAALWGTRYRRPGQKQRAATSLQRWSRRETGSGSEWGGPVPWEGKGPMWDISEGGGDWSY